MKKLFEDSQSMNEGVFRAGYKEIRNCCANCKHFEEGDRYSGDNDLCVWYGADWRGPRDAFTVQGHGVCNLFEYGP